MASTDGHHFGFLFLVFYLGICIGLSSAEMLDMATISTRGCAGSSFAKAEVSYADNIDTGLNFGLGIRSARSVVECSTFCSSEDNCTSAFYEQNREECILTTDNRVSSTESISTKKQSGQFQKVVLYEKGESGGACGESCPSATKCKKDCDQDISICAATHSDCSEFPTANIQQFVWGPFETSQNNGEIAGVTYNKKHDYTYLRVHWRGNSRAAEGQGGHCVRWYFRFNDQECSSPQTIDHQEYHDRARSVYRNLEVDGICYDSFAQGDMTIRLYTGGCHCCHHGNAYTGWGTYSTLIVEEVDMRYSSGTCPGLSLYNIGQDQWWGLSRDEDTGDIPSISYTYNKRSDDTALRVYYMGDMRIYNANNNCGKYYFKFNGAACTNPGNIDSDFYYNDPDNYHKGSLFGGICEGISAGSVTINLALTNCPGYSQGEMYTCWNAGCRIMVEEIRFEQDTMAMISNDNTLTYLPVFNIKYWSWEGSTGGVWSTNDGLIQSVTYTKKSSLSALRVHWQSTLNNGWHGGHIRWYFTFNGNECSDPGRIEQKLYYHNHETNSHHHVHRVGTVEGLCRGFPIGDVDINFYVSAGGADAHTAWNSRAWLIVEEVHLGAYNDI